MARTTRATRHQRDVDGTEVSPLVSLDDPPRRQKPEPKKKLKDDSSKSSKKAHTNGPTEEAHTKSKKASKKQQSEEPLEEGPVKVRKTSKKAPSEEPAEAAPTKERKASKKALDGDPTDETPAKTKKTPKKTSQTEATEEVPVKVKHATKKTQQVEPSEEASVKVDQTAKKSQTEAAEQASKTKHISKKISQTESIDEPTSTKKSRTQPKKVDSDDKATKAARAGSPVHDINTDNGPVLAVAFDDQPQLPVATSPLKTTRARARSPAKATPVIQVPSQEQQKSAPMEDETQSTTLEKFPSALLLSPFPPSPLHDQLIKYEPSPDSTPCPTNWSSMRKGSHRAPNPNPFSRISYEVPECNNSCRSESEGTSVAQGWQTPEFGYSSLYYKQGSQGGEEPFGIVVTTCVSDRLHSLGEPTDDDPMALDCTVKPQLASTQRPKFVLTTPKGTEAALSSLSGSSGTSSPHSDGPSVLGTTPLEHKQDDSNVKLESLYSQSPLPLEPTLHERSCTIHEPNEDLEISPQNSDVESDVSSKHSSPSEAKAKPVTIGRIQRQLNRETKIYMKFWFAPNAFATHRERELQGTYCLPKFAFLQFLYSLSPEQKVLTEVAPPSEEPQPIVLSTLVSPQKAPSNDSTPSKRKLELPPSTNDERPSPSKRLRTGPKPRTTQARSPAKTNTARVSAKSPVKPRRYAKIGGYDKNGNLVLPGQELLGTTTDADITEAPPNVIPPNSPLAVVRATAGVANSGPLSPSRTFRSNREAVGSKNPPNPSNSQQKDFWHPTDTALIPTTPTRDSQPSIPPATAPNLTTPGRRWNLAGRVTASIGKLNPFSFFSRSAQDLPPQPVPAPAFEPMAEPTTAQGELTSASEVTGSQMVVPTAQQDLILADATDAQSEISSLLLSVLQLRCPDIADEKLVSTVQASFSQSEGIARHKAEEARQRLESITDAKTKRLLVLLEQQHPDLSPDGILSKLDDLISQQQIVANFKQEQAKKHQLPITEVNEAKKRKRPSSPEIIPNPVGKSYGMDLEFFGNSSDSEEGDDMSEVEFERPAKVPRLEKQPISSRPAYTRGNLGSKLFSSGDKRTTATPSKNTVEMSVDDPKRASPYAGSIFRDAHEAPDNIFGSPGALGTASAEKTVGHFEVPLSSSDSDDSDTELPPTPSKHAPIQNKSAIGSSSILKGSPLNAAAKAAKELPAQETPTQEIPAKDTPKSITSQEQMKDSSAAPSPPPAPTPAHAALPPAPATQSQHDPVALARAQANKYAPKTSSKLKSVSRLSNSPAMKSPAGHPLGMEKDGLKRNLNIKMTSLNDYDWEPEVAQAFEQWERTSPIDLSHYDMDPAVSEALAAWDPPMALYIDPIGTHEFDPTAAAFVDAVEFD